jgi:hypothetical protein
MMSKCSNCATSWTSLGMPMCPICGTKVPSSPSAPDPLSRGRASRTSAADQLQGSAAPLKDVSSAVLEMPPELRSPGPKPEGQPKAAPGGWVLSKQQPVAAELTDPAPAIDSAPDTRKPEDPKAPVLTPLPAIESQTVLLKAPSPSSTAEGSATAAPAPTNDAKAETSGTEVSSAPKVPVETQKSENVAPAAPPQEGADTIVLKSSLVATVPKTEPGKQLAPGDPQHAEPIRPSVAAAPNPSEQPQGAELWLRTLESILPTSKLIPKLKTIAPDSPCPAVGRKPSPAETGQPDAVDASVIIKACRPGQSERNWPAPARPLNGPLILGAFALVTGVMIPLTAVFESSRVFGIIGFCMSGFFLPFAPIAWIAGLSVEKRRREQRLRPERRVVVGRLLGQWGTLLLIAEGMIGLVLVAALRLSGKFPATFWAP